MSCSPSPAGAASTPTTRCSTASPPGSNNAPTPSPRTPPLRTALLDAAAMAEVEVEVAGPANIGNYLAGLGIPVTAGFGVDYVGLCGTDKRIRPDTVATVPAVDHSAALILLAG